MGVIGTDGSTAAITGVSQSANGPLDASGPSLFDFSGSAVVVPVVAAQFPVGSMCQLVDGGPIDVHAASAIVPNSQPRRDA